MRISNKINIVFILVLIFVSLLSCSITNAQGYIQTFSKGKILLKDGRLIEGKDMEMSKDIVYLNTTGIYQEFQLSNIRLIQVKKGNAKKWGNVCAGSVMGLSLLALISSGGEITNYYGDTQSINTDQYFIGTLLWAGIFYGGGYLIGYLLDDWETVYIGN